MKLVDGEHILYRVLGDLLASGDESINNALMPYAIFLDPEIAKRFPVLRPGVVRDARQKLISDPYGRTDDWGRADNRGLIRDDNSLLKGLPKPLKIDSIVPQLSGSKLGTGWVASHIWRRTRSLERANSHPWLNSFVPNLVWLPKQISKLSDRDGSAFQSALKIASKEIYGDLTYDNAQVAEVVEFCWRELVEPEASASYSGRTSFFAVEDKWLKRTERRLDALYLAVRSGNLELMRPAGIPTNFQESTGFGTSGFFNGLQEATAFLGEKP